MLSFLELDLVNKINFELFFNPIILSSILLSYVLGFVWRRTAPIGFLNKIFYYFWFLFILPGTIFHEFMHYIIGVFFKARPIGFSIIPKKITGGYVLGSVSFSNLNFINTLPVAMAPILLLPLSLYLIYSFQEFFFHSFYTKVFAGFFIYNLWISSIPSITDFKIVFKNPLTLVFYGIIFISFIKLIKYIEV